MSLEGEMDTRSLAVITSYPYSRLAEELFDRLHDLLYSSLSLNFTMQVQQQSNWCWAATATSVSHFYLLPSSWTQCLGANAELGHNDCCSSPVPGGCNVPWYLDKALTRTDNFESLTGPVSFDTVYNELKAGRAVGARIGWSGGGGHFVAIYGCGRSVGVEYFDIDDPVYGKSQQTVSTFSTSYQGNGTWTHTYFTKRAPIMIKIKPDLLEEEIIRHIWEARPLLQLKYESLREVKSPRDLSLAIPHYVYTMGLDALAQERGLPEFPTALRVLEVQGEKSLAFFDVNIPGQPPQIRQMAGASPYLDLLNQGLTEVFKWTAQSEVEAELRLLQVPALHIDALWLHYDDPTKDVFLPIRAQEALTAFRVYSANDFLAELTKIAKAQPTMDDLMGS
jgi:Papain-like cysteine protease AvrRpt2